MGTERPLWLSTVIHTAVPFFFVSAGFLMGGHAEKGGDFPAYFRKKSLTFLKLWLIWLVIYIPLDVVMELQQDYSVQSFFRWIFKVVSSGEGFWSWPMWYLFSATIGCALISLACRRNVLRGVLWLSLTAIALFVVAKNLTCFVPSSVRLSETMITFIGGRADRFLSGAVFIPAGIILGRSLPVRPDVRIVSFLSVILIAAGCVMACYGVTLDTLPRSVGLVLLAVVLPQVRFNTMPVRMQSMWIYYIHMYCLGALILFGVEPNHGLFVALGIILSVLTALILYILTLCPRFRFLRTLVS